jgi:hypothetical protein
MSCVFGEHVFFAVGRIRAKVYLPLPRQRSQAITTGCGYNGDRQDAAVDGGQGVDRHPAYHADQCDGSTGLPPEVERIVTPHESNRGEDQSEDAESKQRSRGSERSAMVPANIRDSVVRKRRIALLRVRRALPDAIIRVGPVVNGEPRYSRGDDLRYLGGGHV